MFKKILILYYYFIAKKFKNFKNREELEKYQAKKIKKHIQKIRKISKYYNKKYKNYNINNWETLPTINKQELMDNFDLLNTASIKKEEAFQVALKAEQNRDFSPTINNITVGLSSGTSGNRGIFLVSSKEQALWAANVLAKILPKPIFCKNKIAFFLRANSNLYESVKTKTIEFEYFDLLTPLEINIQKLNKYNPNIIVAPPSMLRLIAENYNKLSIKPIKIISVAEVLDDIDKKYIEETFHQPIHQIYQATEGFIATTCKYGHLHINEDLLVIQKDYIDKQAGKFIPIITDFNRTTEPIIRYRLNDILTENLEPCPCGSPFLRIEKIEGRCDDLFYFINKDTNKKSIIFPDFISRAVIYSDPNITDYKVIQISEQELNVYIDKSDSFEKVKQNILNVINRHNCIIPKIKQIESIQHIYTNKFKRIESLLKENKNEK